MDYEGAVCVLNSLQSNAAALNQENPALKLQAMRVFLHRTAIKVAELDKLNIIHVTGTKGKGSTCAFTERILRSYGFRTGFYSSPHLVHVRERIRINGQPISKQLFAKYFWQVYEQLEATKAVHGGCMPFYFQFLTLLAFHVFLQEQVDVAVIEVGIGGEYDCTNIIRKPWVCGITALDLDHCSLLGDTLEKIAWQKAGIFKSGVPAFTVRQPADPLRVLQDRSAQIGCHLRICPELDEYEAMVGPLELNLAGKHQRINAALALQLIYSWLQRQQAEETAGRYTVLLLQIVTLSPSPFHSCPGLQQTEWLGRNQVVRRGSVTYYLDGAHSPASIQACIHWFTQATLHGDQIENCGVRVLLFNSTGDRDSAAFLRLLVPCQFDYAVFCPNITEMPSNHTAQQSSISVSMQHMLAHCRQNQSSWQSLTAAQTVNQQHQHLANSGNHTFVFPSIPSALQWITLGTERVLASAGSRRSGTFLPQSEFSVEQREACQTTVLVTGSLHLVGGVLKHLEPSLDS
ncbi:folylpolyglutamate synthase, mitochondrial-like [Genypterus blacodes]|uniref:folylpolyglutamate synthase, mitochondrial-like n=1 Tax=Genypterus blacodes TaxID=154954 RepID=UPI003F76F178